MEASMRTQTLQAFFTACRTNMVDVVKQLIPVSAKKWKVDTPFLVWFFFYFFDENQLLPLATTVMDQDKKTAIFHAVEGRAA